MPRRCRWVFTALCSSISYPSWSPGAILVFSGLALPAGPRRCYIVILAAIAGLLWLQGDVLPWGYGSLDGSFIDWQPEAWKGYVDSSIWLAVLVAAVCWRRHLVPRLRSGVLLLLAVQLGSLLFYEPLGRIGQEAPALDVETGSSRQAGTVFSLPQCDPYCPGRFPVGRL